MSKLVSVVIMAVTKMVNSKRAPVGKVEVPVPTLKDIGFDIEPTKTEEDGSLVYAADLHNWLYGAIKAATMQKARNSLIAGTVDFKDGIDAFASTLEDLSAPAANGGNAEAALAITAFKNSFKAYLAEAGLASQAQAFLNAQVAAPKGLLMQPEGYRTKVAERLGMWAEWAEANDAEVLENAHVVRYVTKLDANCSAEAEELDLGAL